MKATRITVFQNKEFIAEEIYLLASKSEAIKRCKKRNPEFNRKDIKIVATDYDTDECKMHFEACCKCGVVFFYNTSY